jgi:hypothetical protein
MHRRPERRGRHAARIATAVAVAVIAAGAIAAALSNTSPPQTPSATVSLADCARPAPRPAMRVCYADAMLQEVHDAQDPTAVLTRIDREVNRIGEYPASNCHTLMHGVGRRYARLHKVTLATLMDYLPHNNDAGCAAGFAHGIITAIAPEILRAGPAAAEQVCGKATTRFLRYSCTHGLGHAYMRYYAESLRPSLELCRALGLNIAPDCAQGVYHDYWLAVVGADETKRPASATTNVRELCERQPRGFVLGCWYRAFIETRPAGYQTKSAADLTHICADTTGLQRQGCITAASVIGSSNPLEQMRVCAQLPKRDVLPCVHGVKVQNLIDTPASNQLLVISRCELFKGALATGCYEWLGKVLEVITDGTFSRTGCPQVVQSQACLRGARSYEGPLVTFS